MAEPARTPLGDLVVGAAWLGFLVAFLVGSLLPAVVGLVLLSAVAASRRQLAGVTVTARRRLPSRAEAEEAFHVRLEASSAPPLPLRVREHPPQGLRIASRAPGGGRGRATEDLALVAPSAGTIEFAEATVAVTDPWGFYEARRAIVLRERLRLEPPSLIAGVARRLGRRSAVETVRRSRRGHDLLPETERVREYQPGDRTRDIDWPRTSRQAAIIVRERERAAPRPVAILLDASPSMRWQRRVAKITTAAALASAVAAAANAAGVRASVVFFDEQGVMPTSLSSDREGARAGAARLASLPPPIPVHDIPRFAMLDRPLDGRERRALQALAPFVAGAGPGLPPLDASLRLLDRATSGRTLVIPILDAESHPRRAEVAAQRLAFAGHDVVVVAPATGPHHYSRAEAVGPILDEIVRARIRRDALRARLAPRGVPVLSLRPGGEVDTLREVVDWMT